MEALGRSLPAKLVGLRFCAPNLLTLGIKSPIPGIHAQCVEFNPIANADGSACGRRAAVGGCGAHKTCGDGFEEDRADCFGKIGEGDRPLRPLTEIDNGLGLVEFEGTRSHGLAEGLPGEFEDSLAVGVGEFGGEGLFLVEIDDVGVGRRDCGAAGGHGDIADFGVLGGALGGVHAADQVLGRAIDFGVSEEGGGLEQSDCEDVSEWLQEEFHCPMLKMCP
jgi:hypothetical protein